MDGHTLSQSDLETKMIKLAWSSESDVGLRRKNNEDSVIAEPPVFAVADGMGGHAAGDVASAIAVEGLRQLAGHMGVTRREVLEAIRRANETICRQALKNETAGMGTTLTGLVITRSEDGNDGVVVFNVGDSRSYLLRDDVLTQVSHDHSVVQELIDSGTITKAEAIGHPESNVITRSLGVTTGLDIDWWLLSPITGDRYLLCSDGLFKCVSQDRIHEILLAHPGPHDTSQTLLEAALLGGGDDNISIINVDTRPRAEIDDLTAQDTRPRPAQPTEPDRDPSDPVPSITSFKVVDSEVDNSSLTMAGNNTETIETDGNPPEIQHPIADEP